MRNICTIKPKDVFYNRTTRKIVHIVNCFHLKPIGEYVVNYRYIENWIPEYTISLKAFNKSFERKLVV
jgi:hypothetical protein